MLVTGHAYTPPPCIRETTLTELLGGVRSIDERQQKRLDLPGSMRPETPLRLFYVGDPSLVQRPCVAVVGARKVSPEGERRAQRVTRELVRFGVVVVSGLALGVDGNAHRAAISEGGKTVGVLGTPLDAVNPKSHAELQETIYRDHLLISQFPIGSKVWPGNFPQRNKIMAAITDATVIIEASDTSGSLHQASECVRLDRWLFVARSVFDNPNLDWPAKFKKYPKTRALDRTEDIVEAITCR